MKYKSVRKKKPKRTTINWFHYRNDEFFFHKKFFVLCTLFSVAPVLLKVKTTQFVLLNRSSFLWCPAKGAPAPLIIWRKNGIIVQNSTSIRYKLGIVKENKDTFSCEVKKNDQVARKLVLYMESKF